VGEVVRLNVDPKALDRAKGCECGSGPRLVERSRGDLVRITCCGCWSHTSYYKLERDAWQAWIASKVYKDHWPHIKRKRKASRP
jgi:hypothetical protein